MKQVQVSPKIIKICLTTFFQNAFSERTLKTIKDFDQSPLGEIYIKDYEAPYQNDIIAVLQKLSPKVLSDPDDIPFFIEKIPKHLQVCLWVRCDVAIDHLQHFHKPLTIPADMSQFYLWALNDFYFNANALMTKEEEAISAHPMKNVVTLFPPLK